MKGDFENFHVKNEIGACDTRFTPFVNTMIDLTFDEIIVYHFEGHKVYKHCL